MDQPSEEWLSHAATPKMSEVWVLLTKHSKRPQDLMILNDSTTTWYNCTYRDTFVIWQDCHVWSNDFNVNISGCAFVRQSCPAKDLSECQQIQVPEALIRGDWMVHSCVTNYAEQSKTSPIFLLFLFLLVIILLCVPVRMDFFLLAKLPGSFGIVT